MKSKLKVFLVEGDIQSRIAYERRLKYLGHEVVVAKDAEQAVNLYDGNEGFDAIICGIEMSPGDGIFFLDYLRHTVIETSELPRVLIHNTARFYYSKLFLLLDLARDIHKLIGHAEFHQKDRSGSYLEDFLGRVAHQTA